jgi:hypothetical protein
MQYDALPGICMGERTKVYPPHTHEYDKDCTYDPIKPFTMHIIAIHSLYPKFCQLLNLRSQPAIWGEALIT